MDEVAAFADLTPEIRRKIALLAKVDTLAADEEVSGFGAAIVIDGSAYLSATILDAQVAPAPPRTLLTTRGTLSETIALRMVAGDGGARVALWEASAIEEALRTHCPDVLAELARQADRFQAFAGATIGPLADLDEATRAHLFERFTVRVARAGEPIVDGGSKLAGVTVVCVGSLDLGPGAGMVRAGELLFPRASRREMPAPTSARAGASGAILLVGDRALADRLAAAPALAAAFAD